MRISLISHLSCKLSLGWIGLFFIQQTLPFKVIILGDLIDSKSIWTILSVLEAPRLLNDRSWSVLLYSVFFFFILVRLVVLCDCEQLLIPRTVPTVDGWVWIIKRARLPTSIMKLSV